MFISSFHIYDLFSGSVVLVVIFIIVVVIIVVTATNVVVVAVFVAVDELAFSTGLYNTNRATEITVARVVVVVIVAVVIVVVVVVTVIVALFFGTSGVIYASILTAVASLALYI